MIAIAILLPALILAALAGELIRRGFRDGDRPGDVRVTLGSIVRPETAAGAWAEVRVKNPGEQVALVGIGVRCVLLGGADGRSSASWRANRRLANQQIGAVAAGAEESFWIWAEPAAHRTRLIVTVGTSGRLRRHRLGLRDGSQAPELEPLPVPIEG